MPPDRLLHVAYPQLNQRLFLFGERPGKSNESSSREKSLRSTPTVIGLPQGQASALSLYIS